MSGELILKRSHKWKQTLPAVALTAAATFLLIWVMMRHVDMSGIMMGIMVAVVTYVLFRTLYPSLASLFGGKQDSGRVAWDYNGDTLRLGEETYSRDNIKMVHCWPNRDALGHQLPGWTVNIETVKGKNKVLCSLDDGQGVEESVESIHELVVALGYGSGWTEEQA